MLPSFICIKLLLLMTRARVCLGTAVPSPFSSYFSSSSFSFGALRFGSDGIASTIKEASTFLVFVLSNLD